MTDLSPFVPDRGAADGSAQVCLFEANPGPGCGEPGTWHVLWDPKRASISCDPHMALIQSRWVYTDRHRIAPDCGMPNAAWLPDRCEVPRSCPTPAENTATPERTRT